MSKTDVLPDERNLNAIQAMRLSGLTGLPASEFEDHTIAALAERLRWVVDPDLWLFRRICGQVVKADPATGENLPVPNATVEVFDTVCDHWGFFPEPWPWGWLFPIRCERHLIATVTTDGCGCFCFWLPAFEIEWILRWREERLCFPDLFVKPSIADLIAPLSAETLASNSAALTTRLRPGGDLAATLGARAASVLSAVRGPAGFGDDVSHLANVLKSPGFTQPVTPPLPTLPTSNEDAVHVPALAEIDPSRFFGPFMRCVDVFVPEWYELIGVPDVSLTVTQALPGGTATIYEGAFDIPWGSNPIPPVILPASSQAIASTVPCPPPAVDPEGLGFQFVGLLPVSTGYTAGGTLDADGFATRVNPPIQPIPPLAPGCNCPSDLMVEPNCPGTSPFYGELYLYGGVSYPGADYYRIMTQYAPTPPIASATPASPLLNPWWVPQPFPAPPYRMAPVNTDGWYPISGLAYESDSYTGMLMDWPSNAAARPDGAYLLTLELADATFTPIALAAPPTLQLVLDGSPPTTTTFTVGWLPASMVDTSSSAGWSALPWNAAYPPPAGCPLIDTGGEAIALYFTAGLTAAHLRQASAGVSGCGGTIPTPAPANPPDSQWYASSTDASATSFSFAGVYTLPANATVGCYSFELYGDTRAFNAAGGTAANMVSNLWCADEVDPPQTNPSISIAII